MRLSSVDLLSTHFRILVSPYWEPYTITAGFHSLSTHLGQWACGMIWLICIASSGIFQCEHLKSPPWEHMSQSGGQQCDPGPWPPRTTSSIQVFDPREERLAAEGQSDEGRGQVTEKGRSQSDDWMMPHCAMVVRETDLEPLDYDLDLSREVAWGLNWN